MRTPYQYGIPLLSLFMVRVDLTDLYPLKIPVRMEKVLDGDTVKVSSGNYLLKLRLSRIDSPEKGQPFLGSSKGDAGVFASDCFKKTIGNKKDFTLRLERFDIYGRMLGDIDELSLRLIQNGCASLYPMAEFSSRQEKWIYLKAIKTAKENRVGLWSRGGYEVPKSWRKKYLRFSKRIAHQQWRR